MAGSTARLGLYLPGGGSTGQWTPDEVADIDKLNGNFNRLDDIVGAKGVLSTARPGSPFDGQLDFETDTSNLIRFDQSSSSWRGLGIPKVNSSAQRDEMFPSPQQGDKCFRTDVMCEQTYYGLYNATTNPLGGNVAGWGFSAAGGRQVVTALGTTGSTFASGGSITANPDGSYSFTSGRILNFNGIFWNRYRHFFIALQTWQFTGSSDTQIFLHFGTGGTASASAAYDASANYYRQQLVGSGTTASAQQNLNQPNLWAPQSSSNGHILELDLYDIAYPDTSTRGLAKIQDWDGATGYPVVGLVAMNYGPHKAFDSIQIDFDTATGNQTGVVTFYGII